MIVDYDNQTLVEVCGTAQMERCVTIKINWSLKQSQVGRVCKYHHSHVGVKLRM